MPDNRYASEVEDIITIISPPATNKYTTLKTELIRRLSLSQDQRVRQLLAQEELGDRKPSQFLRHLRSLAGSSRLEDSILRTLWLQRLPTHVQQILQTQAHQPLDSQAAMADTICEVASIPTIAPPVAAVMQPAWPVASTPTPPGATPQQPYQTTTNTAQVAALNSSVDLAALVQEIANLARQFCYEGVQAKLCFYRGCVSGRTQKISPYNFFREVGS